MGGSYLFRGGVVYTVNPTQPWAQAVVVRGDRIVFVGPVADADAHCDADTTVVDLAGGMCLPGFVDGHNHLAMGAITKLGVSVRGITGKEAILAHIAEWVAGQPDRAPLRGHGWLPGSFVEGSPRREWLDEVTGDRPMMLLSVDAHDVWFNTAAMRCADVSAATKDPAPGAQYYRRDADGTPTGHGVDLGSSSPLFAAMGYFSSDAIDAALAAGLLRAPSWGITTYMDAGVLIGDTCADAEPVFERLLGLDQAGELPVRVVGCVWTRSPHDDPDVIVAVLTDWHQRFRSPHLRVSVCKVFSDGTLMSGGALLLEPFSDAPDRRGRMTLDFAHLVAIVGAVQRAGFNVHIHADADGSVRTVLDAIAEVQARLGQCAHRHTIAHNSLVHPDDRGRFAQLGVVANTTPLWGTDYDGAFLDVYTRIIGPQRIRERLFPYGDLLRAGATLTIGADVPGVDIDEAAPLIQLEAAVTRKRPSHPDDRPLAEHQRMPLADALRAYTINGAYQLRMEDTVGSIEVGKKADLVVLGSDLFAVRPEDIHTVPVILTMMDGLITHDARPAGHPYPAVSRSPVG